MKMIVEYLGTGPNPIATRGVKSEKPHLFAGDQGVTTEEIATQLEQQGLYKIVGPADKPAAE
jgi:hypothetical protein